ncbi:hypothetical protein JAAARDRAFT_654376 [Jaapia argillacea MUCL 33604]|uniref:Uncharacterized protein n=1 Tax=Jaapia argillacea MUCL 33604 TaxID=933084 RepID=A0A067Q6N8_9AGAM|nr:hypothetical protein JAAARDRAFT_654376 [Jaapia argillacea MUCL 33604]
MLDCFLTGESNQQIHPNMVISARPQIERGALHQGFIRASRLRDPTVAQDTSKRLRGSQYPPFHLFQLFFPPYIFQTLRGVPLPLHQPGLYLWNSNILSPIPFTSPCKLRICRCTGSRTQVFGTTSYPSILSHYEVHIILHLGTSIYITTRPPIRTQAREVMALRKRWRNRYTVSSPLTFNSPSTISSRHLSPGQEVLHSSRMMRRSYHPRSHIDSKPSR